MVFFKKSNVEPEALKAERLKAPTGNYREPTIIESIKNDFFDKCYICESRGITAINIEHFAPHKETDMIRKYNWSNLFWSCSHCNTIKSSSYDGKLLNCTVLEDSVDTKINYKINSEADRNEDKIEISSNDTDINTINTVNLLNKVYKGTTDLNIHQPAAIRNKIIDEVYSFICAIDKYLLLDDYQKETYLEFIKNGLSNKSPYCAFKRNIVRNKKKYSELIQYINP